MESGRITAKEKPVRLDWILSGSLCVNRAWMYSNQVLQEQLRIWRGNQHVFVSTVLRKKQLANQQAIQMNDSQE